MKKRIITLLVVVFLATAPAFSQNPWSDHENRTTVSLEWDSPQFGTDFMGRIRTTKLTSVGYLNARIRLIDNMFILAEVPVSYYDWKLEGDRSSLSNKNMELGSPYFGTEIRLNEGPGVWQPYINMGTYLPRKQKSLTAEEFLESFSVLDEYGELATPALVHNIRLGAHPALLSDFDRGEAFWEDTWSVRANAGISRLLNDSKYRVRFSTGLIRNIYRGEWAEILDPETYLTYSAYLSYNPEGYIVHTVLYGRSPMGIRGLDFKEDTLMQFRAGLGRNFGIVNVGGYFRVPLINKYIYNVKFSYGLNLAISI